MTESTVSVRPPLVSYEDLARAIDYAVLDPNASEEQVSDACHSARKLGVGRFTIRPADIDLVTQWMSGSSIPIGTTAGFPHGSETTAAKLYQVADALRRGAKAIETVLNPGKTISRQFRYVESELAQMAQECHRAGAELILDIEWGWLSPDLRVIACKLARRAEVDWVRVRSLYGPAGEADLPFLAAKLGDLVKLDAGGTADTVEKVLAAHAAGATGFQSPNPAPLLDAWSAELRQRANPAEQRQIGNR